MNANGTPANLRPFPRGVSPHPAGKPVAARNRLSGAFLKALADDFAKHGRAAIERCRVDTPSRYLQIVASLLPREVAIETRGPTLAELLAMARVREAELGPMPPPPRLGGLLGMSGASTPHADCAEQPGDVAARAAPIPVVVPIDD
jgi:hypothetical protein